MAILIFYVVLGQFWFHAFKQLISQYFLNRQELTGFQTILVASLLTLIFLF